jgi:hypothetical protein
VLLGLAVLFFSIFLFPLVLLGFWVQGARGRDVTDGWKRGVLAGWRLTSGRFQ